MKTSSKKFVFFVIDVYLKNVKIQKNDIGVFIENRPNGMSLILHASSGKQIEFSSRDFKIFDISKTGDLFEKKVCNVCHRLLPTPEFARNQNGKNNRPIRRPSCNECRKEVDGAKASKNEVREWLAKKPHLELFRCPICQKITIPGLTSKVVMDHDHKTGHIRWWICDSCNTGIGRFKDDITLLERAIEYLKATDH